MAVLLRNLTNINKVKTGEGFLSLSRYPAFSKYRA